MIGHYEFWTVSLSFAVAGLSGFAAFESVRHARNSRRTWLWTLIGGLVLGLGVWSMHFVGMLAWVPPFPLFYSVTRTVESMIAAIFASILAMHLAVAPALPSRFRLTLGAISVATGVCSMHYIGMAALHFSIPETWSLPWLFASIAVALAASFAALLLLHRSNREDFAIRHQVTGALAIGLAISGMHYSGMQAMMLSHGAVALQAPGDASGAALARIGVGNTLIFTFCLLVVSYHDRLRLMHMAHDAMMEAQEAGRVAEQLSAAGRIAASIAHEVNNPLGAVTNLIYLAEHSDAGPVSLAYLHQAQGELRRVAEITTHSLKFHRQQHAATSTSLVEAVESVLLLFANKLDTKHILVEKSWETGLGKVECRAGEIRQVIANLVENAVDAMTDSGTLSLALRSYENCIELSVGDTGPGIPREIREKMFQPFFTTKGATATGLGLAISAEILGRHHGTLRFETRTEPPNQGTTAIMALPLRAPEREPEFTLTEM